MNDPITGTPTCDSCGVPESDELEMVVCFEDGQTYHYCDGCYAP